MRGFLPLGSAGDSACDGHHEMSDLGAGGELVHSGGEIYIEFGGYKVTSSDVVDAAKLVWNKLF